MLIKPAAGVTIEGDERARAELLRLGSLAARALAATVEHVEVRAEEEAGRHSKSGALVRSVDKRRVGDGWEVFHDAQVAPHALFVHWPTKPHLIKPRKKKALRWPGPAAFVFAKGVHHPGTKGDPWMARLANEAPRIFAEQLALRIAQDSNP